MNGGPRSLSARLALVAGVLVISCAAPAAATDEEPTPQDPPSAGTGADAPTEVIQGSLADGGEPVPGVTVVVRDAQGEPVGEAVSEDDGRWEVPVPGSATYEVELLADTLPDDVALTDPERAVLTNVVVFSGRDKTVRFSLGDAASRPARARPDPGNRAANLAWSGLGLGLVIALCSIGLSLVFGTTGLVNFAHGELVAFGALATWFFNSPTIGPTLGLWPAATLGFVTAAAFGGLLHTGLWRPLERRRTNLLAMMIVSIGLGLFLRHVFEIVFGSSPRPFVQYAAQRPWRWGPVVFPPKQLAVMAICAVVLVVVVAGMQRTRLGTAIRAVSDNRDLAESSGIAVDRIVLLVWVLGAGLAGLGGVMFGITQSVQWNMGFRLLLTIFAAVILGGLGSVYGPIIGGLVIGMVAELSAIWFPSEFRTAWALGVLILVLLVRPQGILGVRERVG